MMQRFSVGLLVVAYVLLLYTSLATPSYARAHPNLGIAMLAEYAAPWPVALGTALSITGIMLALIPIRRGENWAIWTSFAAFLLLLITRLTTDPRCLAVLDPHQHGCHTFMIAVVLGVVGLALAFAASRRIAQ